MHEAGFTEQIVASILEGLKNQPDVKPEKVVVRVGEVFHLEPQSVRMHYRLLTHGSPLEEIKLDLQEIPLTIECRQCKRTGSVEDHHLLMCTHCDSLNVTVLSGNTIETEIIPHDEG